MHSEGLEISNNQASGAIGASGFNGGSCGGIQDDDFDMEEDEEEDDLDDG